LSKLTVGIGSVRVNYAPALNDGTAICSRP